jgi:hypothetical protein
MILLLLIIIIMLMLLLLLHPFPFSDSASSQEICSSVGPGKYRGYFNGDSTESNKVTSDDTEKSPERKHKSKSTSLPKYRRNTTSLKVMLSFNDYNCFGTY